MARILIIDSSLKVVQASRSPLEKEGYSYIIQSCDSFNTAISLVKESIPDLILFDLDSVDFIDLKRILNSPETKAIPVIVTATKDNGSGRIKCIAALWYGSRDYILKPLDENKLIQRIQTQMKLS